MSSSHQERASSSRGPRRQQSQRKLPAAGTPVRGSTTACEGWDAGADGWDAGPDGWDVGPDDATNEATWPLSLPLPLSAPVSGSAFCEQVVSPDSGPEYVSRLHKGQAACIDRLRRLADGKGGALEISPVPFFDMEVAGVYPLR